MENKTQTQYPSGLASLFHAIATRPAPQIVAIRCETCGTNTAEFVMDHGIYEVYQCPHCGGIREIAVR